MAAIVSIEAGDKGHRLCEVWRAIGNHLTSNKLSDIEDAVVVLFGGEDAQALVRHGAMMSGKVIIDCRTSPDICNLRKAPSDAEVLADLLPAAKIVKAFNAITPEAIRFVSSRHVSNIGSVYTSGLYCGDDAEAKRIVAGLIAEVNLDPIDCGPLANAVLLSGVGLLVDYLDRGTVGSPLAITVVRRSEEHSLLDRWM